MSKLKNAISELFKDVFAGDFESDGSYYCPDSNKGLSAESVTILRDFGEKGSSIHQWNGIDSLIGSENPSRYVLLRFDDLIGQRWVGYIDPFTQVCSWPPQVAGKKPDAWCELPPEVRQ